jgi:hypothetical protein
MVGSELRTLIKSSRFKIKWLWRIMADAADCHSVVSKDRRGFDSLHNRKTESISIRVDYWHWKPEVVGSSPVSLTKIEM